MKLCVENVSKRFGSKLAVDHVDAELSEGVYGFLGANGAGKTTLMQIICGIVRPTEGQIMLDGRNHIKMGEEFRDLLGYLPQEFGYTPGFTAKEFLLYVASVKGLVPEYAKKRTKELLELVNLSDEANRKIKTFSGGMKRRLGIAQALLNRPKLLICDEPTSALDPVGRKEILDILMAVREQTTVLFSTHILSDVERICTDVAFLNDGVVNIQGKLSDIKSQYRTEEYVLETGNEEELKLLMNVFAGLKKSGMNTASFRENDHTLFDILRFVTDNRIRLLKIERVEPTLETLFMEVVEK